MFSRDPKDLANPQLMKFPNQRFLPFAVDLVHGQKQRLAHALKLSNQLTIGARELGPGIDHHDDSDGFFQSDLRLPENFRRDKFLILGNDAARVHHAKRVPSPLSFAIKPVTSDARLVANDGAPRPSQLIEQRGFADVGTAHDGEQWQCSRIVVRSLLH